MRNDYSRYQSVFSWRYGSEEMRKIFSQRYRLETWRKIWVALARAQMKAGLVTKEELADLVRCESEIDFELIEKIEKETDHDVVAAIKEYASKAKRGGGKIHLGATSMDVADNADAFIMKKAMGVVEQRLASLLIEFVGKIEGTMDLVGMGYTHLQPAEPTLMAYRLASYGQDLCVNLEELEFVRKVVRTKGMKGAVGTAASYWELLSGRVMGVASMEQEVMEELGLKAATITSQVYPRINDYMVLSWLTAVTISCAKFAGDLRIMQMPMIGEWSEPFGKNQVGSSAMPFKRNPVTAEKICSLARLVSKDALVAAENAMLSHLERTLDDSANRRVILAESFLATDEILKSSEKIVDGLVINRERVKGNLEKYGSFARIEGILMETVKRGANRQEMHEELRKIAMDAWGEVEKGKDNPIMDRLLNSNLIGKYLKSEELGREFEIEAYIGDAGFRVKKALRRMKKEIEKRRGKKK